MTQFADRATVEQFAAHLKESYLACRELGHNWRPYAAELNRRQRYYERILRCVRCRTERWQVISVSGEILSSHYRYADGYQSNGLGRIVGDGRDALRLESLRRLVAKGD